MVSGQPLQAVTSVQTSGQQQTTGLKLGSAAALSHQQQSTYRHKLQHQRLHDLQSGGVLLSQPKIIVRQQLERGPISTETSKLGYRLQAVVSGNNNQESAEYSPSQQEIHQISSTLNPAYMPSLRLELPKELLPEPTRRRFSMYWDCSLSLECKEVAYLQHLNPLAR
jgi:hypothetical protein